jgi:hypothetical protein
VSPSNCPVCLIGVVEPIGYVELKEGPLEFKTGRVPPSNKSAITITMCSDETCKHVGMGTDQGSLTQGKRLLRELILSLQKRSQTISQSPIKETHINDVTH